MARYHFQGRVRDSYGNILEDTDVSIYLANTTTGAAIYSSYTGSTAVSAVPQITSDADGYFDFFVEPGDYDSGLSQLFDVSAADIDYTYLDVFRQSVSTDEDLTDNSDILIPTQKAVKAYVDSHIVSEKEYNVTYNSTDTTITLTTSDLNSVLLVDNAAAVVVNLPSIGTDNIGMWIKIHKMGIGNLTINGADSDTIEDDSSVENTTVAQTWANILLFVAKETVWKLDGAPMGSWDPV